VLTCPQCGGTAIQQIDAGQYRCLTIRIHQRHRPDPRDPDRGLVENIEVQCGHTWHDPSQVSGTGKMCSCGIVAIGSCRACGRDVCVIHSGDFAGAYRLCKEHLPDKREIEAMEQRQMAEEETEWKASRDDPDFADRLYNGIVALLTERGTPPTVEVKSSTEIERTNWRGRPLLSEERVRTVTRGWLINQVRGRSVKVNAESTAYRSWTQDESTVLGKDGGWWSYTRIHPEGPGDKAPLLKHSADNFRKKNRANVSASEVHQLFLLQRKMHLDTERFMQAQGITPADLGLGLDWPALPIGVWMGSWSNDSFKPFRLREPYVATDEFIRKLGLESPETMEQWRLRRHQKLIDQHGLTDWPDPWW
jgi:hypothetical protein